MILTLFDVVIGKNVTLDVFLRIDFPEGAVISTVSASLGGVVTGMFGSVGIVVSGFLVSATGAALVVPASACLVTSLGAVVLTTVTSMGIIIVGAVVSASNVVSGFV